MDVTVYLYNTDGKLMPGAVTKRIEGGEKASWQRHLDSQIIVIARRPNDGVIVSREDFDGVRLAGSCGVRPQ